MPHEIYDSDAMFFAEYEPTETGWNVGGKLPWHKMGEGIPKDTTPGELKGMIDERGNAVDFELEREPLIDPRGLKSLIGDAVQTLQNLGRPAEMTEIERAIAQIEAGLCTTVKEGGAAFEDVMGGKLDAMYRSDRGDCAALSAVKPSYHQLPNTQVLEICDQLRHPVTGKKLTVETAGTVRRGTKFYMSLRMDEVEVVPGDVIHRYFFCITDHTGAVSFQICYTDIRPVCANTVGMILRAEKNAKTGHKIRHTANMEVRIAQATRQMGLIMLQADQQLELYKTLAATPINDLQFQEVVNKVIPLPEVKDDESSRSRTIAENKQGIVLGNWDGRGRGSHLEHVRGTAWGGFNAFTDWLTHEASLGVKGAANDQERAGNRMINLAMGTGRDIAAKAAHELVSLAA